MIRKWSYLTNTNTINVNLLQSKITPIYNFKVFRHTTRFKKYNKSTNTKMVRKSYSKRKHKNNWINMVYITRSWVSFFLKNKQFVRFYQTLGLFNSQSFSSTVLVFNKQVVKFGSDSSFNTFACSKNIISFYNSNTNFIFNYKTPLKTSPSVGLLFHKNLINSEYKDLNPGLIQYDKLLYPYNNIIITEKNILTWSFLHSSIFNLVNKYVLFVYRINILITLYIMF